MEFGKFEKFEKVVFYGIPKAMCNQELKLCFKQYYAKYLFFKDIIENNNCKYDITIISMARRNYINAYSICNKLAQEIEKREELDLLELKKNV